MLWAEFEESLLEVLAGGVRVGGSACAAAASGRHDRDRRRASRRACSISNDESDFYTIVDVIGERPPRPALRPDAHARRARLEIYISKAATMLDQVTDTFYVKDARGAQKLNDPERDRERCARRCSTRGASRGEAPGLAA